MERRFTYYGSYTSALPAWVGDSIIAYANKLPTDTYLTKDGSDRVSAWIDQTASGINAVQGTGSDQPLWVTGGVNGGLRCVGGTFGDFLKTGDLPVSSSFTLSIWFKKSGTAGIQTLFASSHYYTGGYNGNFVLRIDNASNIGFHTYDGTGNYQGRNYSAPTTVGNWFNVRLVGNGALVELFFNNVSKGAGSLTKALTDLSTGGLMIGDDRAGGNVGFTGDFGAAQYWDKAQDAAERTANWDELRGDFGL